MSRAAASAPAGKCTQGGLLPVGGATRALALPHLLYADAVHADLADAGMPPEVLEVGVRGTSSPVLFMRFVWTAGSARLDSGVPGLVLAWSHVAGWSAHSADAAELLDVDPLADPLVLALAALDLAAQPLAGPWSPPDGAGRWPQAPALDAALIAFDERTVQ